MFQSKVNGHRESMRTNAAQLIKRVHNMPNVILKLVRKLVVLDEVVGLFSSFLSSLIDNLQAVWAATASRPYTVLLISIFVAILLGIQPCEEMVG